MKRFLINGFALGLLILAAWFCSLPLASGEQLPEFEKLTIYGNVEIQEIDGGFTVFCLEFPCNFELLEIPQVDPEDVPDNQLPEFCHDEDGNIFVCPTPTP